MKRIDLIKKIKSFGCILVRSQGKHNPQTNVAQPLPRHREIKEPLAKHIIRMLGNDDATDE